MKALMLRHEQSRWRYVPDIGPRRFVAKSRSDHPLEMSPPVPVLRLLSEERYGRCKMLVQRYVTLQSRPQTASPKFTHFTLLSAYQQYVRPQQSSGRHSEDIGRLILTALLSLTGIFASVKRRRTTGSDE